MTPLHDGPRDESWRDDAGFFGRPWLVLGIFLCISLVFALLRALRHVG